MNKPDDLFIKDYTYLLPEDRIAKYPLPKRDESKLLIYEDGIIGESQYKNLNQFLPQNTLLLFNNTKVVEVRLLFQKSSGSFIELFCLEPADDYKDISAAMLQRGSVRWQCLVGGVKKWKAQQLVSVLKREDQELVLTAERLQKSGDSFLIQFNWNDEEMSFAEVLHLFGNMPLPPYLNRDAEPEDEDRYQTVYAKWEGSVAAPTAGLHFTDAIFESLHRKGIQTDFVTLHVGAGTFKPVKAETVAEHSMHAEFIEVSPGLVENLKAHSGKKTVAVGTTSLRTIESLYWMGVKTIVNSHVSVDDIALLQWEAYELPDTYTAAEALQSLLDWMKNKELHKLISKTQIIIVPGYEFKLTDGLLTNFHQPQSTLLLLIAAIVGNDWKKIYDYALQNDFRFLSYGDGSLLWKK